jgi:hypothetical protein
MLRFLKWLKNADQGRHENPEAGGLEGRGSEFKLQLADSIALSLGSKLKLELSTPPLSRPVTPRNVLLCVRAGKPPVVLLKVRLHEP